MPQFPIRRTITVNYANVIEAVGAAMSVTAVYLLAGLGWALVAGGTFLIVGAEYVYSGLHVRIPLPRKPHPIRKARSWINR